MQPLISSRIIPTESQHIAGLVKKYVRLEDTTSSVILFGSRARGDAASDSDWDFLILTQKKATDILANDLRKIISREVELRYNVAISMIVKNAMLWETDYAVTNIYESISEEGVLI